MSDHLSVADPPSPPTAATTTTTTAPRPVRPSFNSHLTSDRLREGAGLYLPPPFRTDRASNLRKGRTSVFKELGLADDEEDIALVVDGDSASPVASPSSD
ncbi:hypothetical protein CP533_3759 [Ophiocordyceps camponoti-saundersi (nom. inval.)]|nr:hypothetical protein CP533_3759 [Ophiocordyceps camponoti-saundersi (nom. inval.)]